MIDLTINGMPAIPKKDTSIKLTLVNQYFDTSSSFSYDIELPLDIAENRQIFGNINRSDVTLSKIELPAKLTCENFDIIVGTATITNVDDEVVKIQILGEGKATQSVLDEENSYIDEINLGNWYSRYFALDQEIKGSTAWLASTQMRTFLLHDYNSWLNMLFNPIWVTYPILNTDAETICNEYCVRKHNSVIRFEHAFSRPDDDKIYGYPQVKLAIQPYVWYMCKVIAEASGYTLDENDNVLYTNDFYRMIFIANANINIECNRCLPHWTILEWWEQIKKTFGVAISFDNYSKKAKISQRDKYINSSSTFFADNVVDEYSVSLDDDSAYDDITLQNVGFADTDKFSKESFFPEELLEFSTYLKFNNFEEFHDYLETFDHNNDASWQYIFEVEGRHYIWLDTGTIREVDMLRNRIIKPNNKDVDVELKFIPCSFTSTDAKVFDATKDSSTGIYIDKKLGTYPVEILSRPDRANFDWYTDENELSRPKSLRIKDWVFNDAEIPEKEETFDVCYIALHNPNLGDNLNSSWGKFLYPRAILHETETITENYYMDFSRRQYKDKGYSLGLIPIDGQRNLASETIGANKLEIDTSVKYCFKFISDKIPNPNDIFVIKNKTYICDKLEITFTDNGLDKLITGYFFAIN